MPDVVIHGTGPNSSVEMQVDPTRSAGRVSIQPAEVNVKDGQILGGHYKTGFIGGALAGALTAPNVLLQSRWVDTARVQELQRITLGVLCTAFSSGISLDVALYVVRGMTATGSGTGSTTPTPTRAKGTMPASQWPGNGELRVHGTAALTAATGGTLDASPFAYWVYQVTAVQQYNDKDFVREIELRGHPITLVAGEGIIARFETLNLPASNTIKLVGTIEHTERTVL